MKTFKVEKVDASYTNMEYSEWFDYSDVKFPKKIEATLNVSDLHMGLNDGSVLGVIFDMTIDEVFVGQIAFLASNLNEGEDIVNANQTFVIEDGDLDDTGKRLLLGNKGRFRYFISQATIGGANPIPSTATFKAAVLVK